jgi:hypothetical protein
MKEDTTLATPQAGGKIAGRWARQLRRCWCNLWAARKPDTCEATFVDRLGTRIHRETVAATGAEVPSENSANPVRCETALEPTKEVESIKFLPADHSRDSEETRTDILRDIECCLNIKLRGISVKVSGATVTLSGFVDSYVEKRSVGKIVKSFLGGDLGVINLISVKKRVVREGGLEADTQTSLAGQGGIPGSGPRMLLLFLEDPGKLLRQETSMNTWTSSR